MRFLESYPDSFQFVTRKAANAGAQYSVPRALARGLVTKVLPVAMWFEWTGTPRHLCPVCI